MLASCLLACCLHSCTILLHIFVASSLGAVHAKC
uniref:Uncharacterized protein n=1 Tax=Arundo donax TaxID=35708 RepID=A0A0A9HK29_ARUDO